MRHIRLRFEQRTRIFTVACFNRKAPFSLYGNRWKNRLIQFDISSKREWKTFDVLHMCNSNSSLQVFDSMLVFMLSDHKMHNRKDWIAMTTFKSQTHTHKKKNSLIECICYVSHEIFRSNLYISSAVVKTYLRIK